MPRLTVLLIGIGLLLLAACAGNGGDDGAATPRATMGATAQPTSPPPAATVPEPTGASAFAGSRGRVDVPGPAAPPVLELVDVRTGQHEGFDRVVFEFLSDVPAYRLEYVQSPITDCASGFTATIAGEAFLRVRMTPAAAHDEEGNVTFVPTELTPGLPTILEVEGTCDFEAILTWVVGLSEEVDFNVFVLTDPSRVVVDLAHP